MYQKYQTDALVLGSRESGENDRVYALFTKDFGLVRARASAVRKESSKMRYALQNYARASVALVKGKRGWRLAGAAAIKSAHGDPRGVAAFARISELVIRLVHGEEVNRYLFAALAEAHEVFLQERCDAFATIELVCVARILYALGYISSEALETGRASFSAENVRDLASRRRAPALRRGPTPISLFTHTAYTGEYLHEAETMRDKLLSSINRAITETHL
jgi:hypothetical protein